MWVLVFSLGLMLAGGINHVLLQVSLERSADLRGVTAHILYLPC